MLMIFKNLTVFSASCPDAHTSTPGGSYRFGGRKWDYDTRRGCQPLWQALWKWLLLLVAGGILNVPADPDILTGAKGCVGSQETIGVTLGTFSGLVARFEASWATLIFLSFFYVNVLCKLKQVVSSWLDPNLFLPLNHHHHHHHLLHWLLP